MSDLIERQAAINIIKNWLFNDTGYSLGEKNVMKCTIAELEDLPSVTPQQKTGRWIVKKTGSGHDKKYIEKIKKEEGNNTEIIKGMEYRCSNCFYGYVIGYVHEFDIKENAYDYCPYCGAKMEVEE